MPFFLPWDGVEAAAAVVVVDSVVVEVVDSVVDELSVVVDEAVEVVVVVVPDVGHEPFVGITSPWRRCAFSDLLATRISTNGCFFECVRWQTNVFFPAVVVV